MTAWNGLIEALHGIPSLPRAPCRGQHELFDRTDRGHPDTEHAINICRTECPELARCIAWLNGLPRRQQPPGVVAGRVVPELTPPRPRRSDRPDKRKLSPLTDAATRWLAERLAGGEPVASETVRRDAYAAGHSRTSVQKAFRRLNVRSEQRGRHTFWHLPTTATKRPSSARLDDENPSTAKETA